MNLKKSGRKRNRHMARINRPGGGTTRESNKTPTRRKICWSRRRRNSPEGVPFHLKWNRGRTHVWIQFVFGRLPFNLKTTETGQEPRKLLIIKTASTATNDRCPKGSIPGLIPWNLPWGSVGTLAAYKCTIGLCGTPQQLHRSLRSNSRVRMLLYTTAAIVARYR